MTEHLELAADARLIETLRCHASGSIPLWPWHRARLWAAARHCAYRLPLAAIEAALIKQAATLTEQRLRLTLARDGEFELTTTPFKPLAPEHRRVALARDPLRAPSSLLTVKSTYRPWYAAATQWLANQPEVFDVIYVNTRGELCEGSRSNLYLCFEKSSNAPWFTPPRRVGLLPGVARAQLLACADGMVRERTCTLEDLRRAQGLRLSNAVQGWFDVVLCEERAPC